MESETTIRVDPSKWPFDVRALSRKLGVEIVGVDLGAPMDDALFRAIYQAFLRHQVLLFGPQDVPSERQVAFARRFGPVQVPVMSQYHADGFPEVYRLSQLDEHGNPNGRH